MDSVRENIVENARFAPSRLKNKVFIIDEVHMLSTSAFNALLKTLEEPPARVFFFFATTEPNKLPRTILSRCQRFDFRLLSRDELGAIMGAAKHASGVMRDVFDPDGILIYQNNGVGSGQEVPHFHLHVVPRQTGSDWGFGPPHMERFENPQKREKIDFKIHSKDKKATAELMRSN